MSSPRARLAWLVAAVAGVVAAAYRAWLTTRYWGHEEEDWGNLLIIRGVLDSGFRFVETEHMPLYSFLSAAATLLTGDARTGGLLVAVLFGGLTVAVTAWIGWRWLSPAAGVIAAALLTIQPEAALYSASTLRESTYTGLSMLGIALVPRHLRAGAAVLGIAFFARFNVAFSLLPALVLWAAWRTRRGVSDGPTGRQLLGAAAAVGAVVALWMGWYHHENGTVAFWGGVLERNTGEAVSDLSAIERVVAVGKALGGLFFVVLPNHAGHAVVPLGLVGAVLLARGQAAAPEAGRWLLLAALGTAGLLGATAAVSTYEWFHNLYWKWLTPTVPFALLLAAHGGLTLLRRIPGPAAVLVGAGLLVATAATMQRQSAFQTERSRAWYGTQIELAKWAERAWPPGVGMLTDAIPAWYLQARRSPIQVWSWSDPDLPHNDPDAFGAYLTERGIGVVQWFQEEWVGAATAAPWLAAGKAFRAGDAVLLQVAREDGYGFIAYITTQAPGMPVPSEPPPAAAGASGLAAP